MFDFIEKGIYNGNQTLKTHFWEIMSKGADNGDRNKTIYGISCTRETCLKKHTDVL